MSSSRWCGKRFKMRWAKQIKMSRTENKKKNDHVVQLFQSPVIARVSFSMFPLANIIVVLSCTLYSFPGTLSSLYDRDELVHFPSCTVWRY
jgi:hypothetical protein